MNTKIKIILGCSCALIVGTIGFVSASNISSNSSSQVEDKISQASLEKSQYILETIDSNTTTINSSEIIHDELDNKDYYLLENDSYSVKLNTDNSLKGIFSKEISTTQTVSLFDKNETESYIRAKYTELNLPSEYELIYLEKYDDLIWLADFEKNYDGIYNKYESVKVYFIPDTDEIVSLGVFNEPAKFTSSSITEDDAISSAAQKLGFDSNDVVAASLEMEKSNDYYDTSNTDTSVYPTWKIQKSDNSFVYIDANTGDIIGGDCINE